LTTVDYDCIGRSGNYIDRHRYHCRTHTARSQQLLWCGSSACGEGRSKNVKLPHLLFLSRYVQHGKNDNVLEKQGARIRRLHDGRVTTLPISPNAVGASMAQADRGQIAWPYQRRSSGAHDCVNMFNKLNNKLFWKMIKSEYWGGLF
jgi:hypothetical protein